MRPGAVAPSEVSRRARQRINLLVYAVPALFALAFSAASQWGLRDAEAKAPWEPEATESEGPFPTVTPGGRDPDYAVAGVATFTTGTSIVVESIHTGEVGDTPPLDIVTYDRLDLSNAGSVPIDPVGNPGSPHEVVGPTPPLSIGDCTRDEDVAGPPTAYMGSGMANNEAAFFRLTGSAINEVVPIALGGSPNDALLGLAYLGADNWGAAGWIGPDAVVLDIDLSGVTPSWNGVAINFGATNDLFFSFVLTPNKGAGYAAGRGGPAARICKVQYPGATLVTAFGGAGTGCFSSTVGGNAAEARAITVLPNGDLAVAGARWISGTPRMFVLVLDGDTGAIDPNFNGGENGGLWIEDLSGSTQSQGWSVVALESPDGGAGGVAALGWADVASQRTLILVPFDGDRIDARYTGGVVTMPLTTGGFPIDLEIVPYELIVTPTPAFAGNEVAEPAGLRPLGVAPNESFRFAAAGTQGNFTQGFVARFIGAEPTVIFEDHFEGGNPCRWSATQPSTGCLSAVATELEAGIQTTSRRVSSDRR